ncbi:MAG: STAS domain-containing protein [Actinomycetota bacterium]
MPKPDSIDARADLPPAFVCSSTNPGRDAAWVHVAGEVDVVTAPELEQTLRGVESHARLVVLDVRGVTFIDSTGLHAIVDASSVLAGPVTGWWFCAAPRTLTACSR